MPEPQGMTSGYRFLKRVLDLGMGIPALVIFSPILLGVAVLVRLRMGSPVLFVHERAGRGGRPFRMVKFRTMTDTRDAAGQLLPDDQRLTPLGLFLRHASLDELPQLLHVVTGSMSLVGPRPLPMAYVPRYSPVQVRRLEVKPGITGLAQVKGRNTLSWEDKLALDVQYVREVSLGLDLRILAWTVLKVLRRDGIAHAGQATMHEFQGSPTGPEAEDSRNG